MSAAYFVSIEPMRGDSYRLPYTYPNEAAARERAVSAFGEGDFRTIAVIDTSRKRGRQIVDVYDGRWTSDYLHSDEE